MTPNRLTLEARAVDRILTVSRRMRTAFDTSMSRRGLTLARARALFILQRRSSLTQSELGCELALEDATVARLLDAMEKQALIVRHAVAGDRRAKHIVLTAHGRRETEAAETMAANLRGEFLAGACDSDIEACLRVMRRVTANIEANAEGNDNGQA